jgi:hypothetical protein
LPKYLVDALEVDVTNLDLGKSLHIRDLSLEGLNSLFRRYNHRRLQVPRGVQIGAEANA